MDIKEESLALHYDWKGKIEVTTRCDVSDTHGLATAYTPGVAQPCLEIQKDISKSYELTRRHNLVAVVTDGTAVLGLGDIGPESGMPVMEGKCALFKAFADVDAFPICVKSKDVDEIVNTIYLISGSFGGINLEDISAPRCFEIEKKLKEKCDIPIFHDDQHGTAVVVAAALINALKIVKKNLSDIKIVVNGAGAAGIAITKHLINVGADASKIIMVDRSGTLYADKDYKNAAKNEMAAMTNSQKLNGTLADAVVGADMFLGVSAPGVLTEEMVKTMNKDAIVFAMANPVPEIMPDLAKKAGAAVVGTGRSDFPNQINNVLVFPGLFRGVLDCRASEINEEMKVAASYAIAGLVSDEELSPEYVIPAAFDKRVARAVADAVVKAAEETKVARK